MLEERLALFFSVSRLGLHIVHAAFCKLAELRSILPSAHPRALLFPAGVKRGDQQ